MSAPKWLPALLAEHYAPSDCVEAGHFADNEPMVAAHSAHVAAVVWAEFTARAQQAREDVAEAIGEVEGFSLGVWPWLPDADAAVAALLRAMGGDA